MKPAQLRRLRVGYALVTRETRAVTRVTRKPRARVRERFFNSFSSSVHMCKFRESWKSPRNRVTHVTAMLPGVTVRVTRPFTRNQNEG